MTNSEARRQLGNMPTGENRLADRQYEVEDRPNASDYEQDAWVVINSLKDLEEVHRLWVRASQ